MLVALEAGLRAVRRTPPGRAAARMESLTLVAIGVSAAGGLGILAAGGGPRELLHFVYPVFAFGTLPVVAKMAANWEPRRRGLATVLAAAVTFVVLARLAATG